jgi:hypothetical protein
MNSALLKLNYSDFAKGAVIAVIVAFLGAVQQMLTAHGADIAAYDWGFILDLCASAFTAYIAKNLVSDANGKVFGKIG